MMIDTVLQGDALAVLKTLADNSVDSIVTDPPAGISFMGKDWDTFSPEYLKKMEEQEVRKRKPYQQSNGRERKASDSPYSYSSSFAGKYDLSRKGRDAFIKMMTDIMTEALRVLKPGGHALVWALPRTSHWTATALEDAGFEVRDKLYHLFGSGFPKSLAVDRAIDKHLGKDEDREVIGTRRLGIQHNSYNRVAVAEEDKHTPITKPATPEAQQWQGYGTSTKPAVEEWILVRKPLSEASIAANVLKWGTGAINVDGCRVQSTPDYGRSAARADGYVNKGEYFSGENGGIRSGEHLNEYAHPQGRWPSHLLLSHSIWCAPQGVKRVRGNGGVRPDKPIIHNGTAAIFGNGTSGIEFQAYNDQDGMEEVQAWECSPECPIAELDRQSGVRKSGGKSYEDGHTINFSSTYRDGTANLSGYHREPSTGTASRYFQQFSPDVPFLYASKASRSERNRGCEDLPEHEAQSTGWSGESMPLRQDGTERKMPVKQNVHPTVKSLALMRWLIRLITSPGGVVLDCFLGSGSTAVAAIAEGMHFIGIEQDSSYVAIAEARIQHAIHNPPVDVDVAKKKVKGDHKRGQLKKHTGDQYNVYGAYGDHVSDRHADQDGMEEVEDWQCAPDCPIRIIGEQSGMSKSSNTTRSRITPHAGSNGKTMNGGWNGQITEVGYGDSGNASRYFQQFPPDSLFAELEEVAV